jgi:CHAT domain-containing protein/tetratricopeptide (TPR) repeat protein
MPSSWWRASGRALGCAVLAICATERAPAQGAAPPAQPLRDSADLLVRLGNDAYQRGGKADMEEARRSFVLAAALYRREGSTSKEAETVRDVAYLHNVLGRPDSALVYYREVLRLQTGSGERGGLGETLMLIGEVFHEKGLADSALAYYREALPAVRRDGDRTNEGRTLSDLGGIHQRAGRPDSALLYLTDAVAIRREVHDTLGEGVSLNNLALVHQTLGRPDSAITFLRQSLVLRRAVKDRAGEGTTLNNIAFSFEQLGRPDSALGYYRQALPLLEESGKRSTAGVTLANMGRVYLALGRPDSAVAHLNRGLAIKREVGDRLGEGWALNDLGRVYQADHRPDTAIAYYHRALERLRSAGDKAYEGEVLFNLAQTYHRREDRPDLRAAVAYYDSAASARSAVESSAGGDANRLSFAEQDVALYEEWALAWIGRSGEVGAARAARASLLAAERGRAQGLLHLIRAGRAAPMSGADADTVPRLPPRTAALAYLVTRDTLLAWLVLPSAEVLVSRAPVGRDSLAALVESLRGGLGVEDLSGSELAFRAAGALEEPPARRMARRGLRYAESAARTLSEVLLPPALEARLEPGAELVIVPQGPLTLVPFASLPLGRSRSALAEPFGAPHPLRYAPSLAALGEAEARAPAAGSLRGSLVVGNPSMPTVKSFSGRTLRLDSLPSARVEASWVAKRLGAAPLLAGTATESAVRSRLPSAPLIHLATHGYAFSSEARARQSFVALAPGQGQDGLLSVGEVLDDPAIVLRAELVVLSACQTGLGNLRQAEGTVGLQRAFLAKGARSVLVSLWSVSDAVTSLLMQRFYTHWLDDGDHPGKAEALRRAQEDVRATPGYRHPRFWAAFQLVGAR